MGQVYVTLTMKQTEKLIIIKIWTTISIQKINSSPSMQSSSRMELRFISMVPSLLCFKKCSRIQRLQGMVQEFGEQDRQTGLYWCFPYGHSWRTHFFSLLCSSKRKWKWRTMTVIWNIHHEIHNIVWKNLRNWLPSVVWESDVRIEHRWNSINNALFES